MTTRWDIVLAALGAGILAGFQVGKVSPVLPELRSDLGLDLVTAGWLTSLCYATSAVLAVATGMVTDRAGPRRLVLSGMVLLAAGSLLGGLADTGSGLLVSRFLEGIGFVAVTVTAPRLLAVATHPRNYGLVFGIWGAYMPIGMAIAMLGAPAIADVAGWRTFWLVSCALVAGFAVVLGWRLHPSSWPHPFPARTIDWSGVRETLASLPLWLFSLGFALYTLQWFAIMAWLPTFLIEEQGHGTAAAAAWAALVVAINAGGNLAAAWAMHRRVPRWILVAVAYCAMGGAGAGIFLAGTPDALRVPLALVFSAVGGLLPAAALAGAAAGAARAALVATASGSVVQGAALGSLLGPPVFAAAVAGLGGWAASWWVMLAVSGAGLCLAAGLAVSERRAPR